MFGCVFCLYAHSFLGGSGGPESTLNIGGPEGRLGRCDAVGDALCLLVVDCLGGGSLRSMGEHREGVTA